MSKHILNDAKLKLEKWQDNKKFTLSVDHYQNNPNINVGTYDVNSKKYLSVRAGLDIITFNQFLNNFETIITSNSDNAIKISIENSIPENKEMKLVSKLTYGRSDKGIYFIVLKGVNSEFPTVVFEFTGVKFHKFFNESEEFIKKQLSKEFALAWVKTIRNFINSLIMTNYAPVEYKPNGGKNGFNKSGSKQKEESYDSGDDLNF